MYILCTYEQQAEEVIFELTIIRAGTGFASTY